MRTQCSDDICIDELPIQTRGDLLGHIGDDGWRQSIDGEECFTSLCAGADNGVDATAKGFIIYSGGGGEGERKRRSNDGFDGGEGMGGG